MTRVAQTWGGNKVKGKRKKKKDLRSLENMEVRVRRMVMAMASLSAMHFGGRKSASHEIAR